MNIFRLILLIILFLIILAYEFYLDSEDEL